MFHNALILALALLASLSIFGKKQKQIPQASEDGVQWVVFKIEPKNAVVTIDSAQIHPVRDGSLQIFMPPGLHTYNCESPYYKSEKGVFEVSDSLKNSIGIVLAPLYGYVTVISPVAESNLYIDGEPCGIGKTDSWKVMAGNHRLQIIKNDINYYVGSFTIDNGEKKMICPTPEDMTPKRMNDSEIRELVTGSKSAPVAVMSGSDEIKGNGTLNVHSNVTGATVLLNGVESGDTPTLIKSLRASQTYRVTLRKGGYEDATVMIAPNSEGNTDVYIKMKKK